MRQQNPLAPPDYPWVNYNELSPYSLAFKKQTGEGIRDWWNTAKKYAGKAADLYSSEIGTMAKNLIPSSDENARNSFPGEKHAILQLPNGKYGIANWAGPGTRVMERLKRGDPPRSYVDEVAKAHDIRYALSGGDPNKVREADHKMISAIHLGKKNKSDTNQNLAAAEALMTGKILAEELDLLKKGSFASNTPLSVEDRALLEKSIEPLKQKGLGESTVERLMKFAKEGKGVRQAGEGTRQAGLGVVQSGATRLSYGNGMPDVTDIITKVALPLIMKKAGTVMHKAGMKQSGKGPMGILSKETVEKIKQKFNEPGDKKPNASYHSKVLFPIVMSGTGLSKEQILNLKDSPLYNKFDSMIGNINKQFSGKFGNGVLRSGDMRKIASYTNNQIQGNGFWSDLWEGIKYGFNKTKNVLSETVGKMDIPVVSDAVKILEKIPDIPNAAKSLKELKRKTKKK